jgi:repressor LexA
VPIPPSELTPRQRRILEFIAAFSASNGFAPTMREIGDGVGLTSSSVLNCLERLRDRGLLTWRAHSPRTIQVLDPGAVSR